MPQKAHVSVGLLCAEELNIASEIILVRSKLRVRVFSAVGGLNIELNPL